MDGTACTVLSLLRHEHCEESFSIFLFRKYHIFKTLIPNEMMSSSSRRLLLNSLHTSCQNIRIVLDDIVTCDI
ncbi:hypothetical protein EUGRSUZ_H02455 [Eucalyptus grandis]|uniref:Uncharacterized protein n=2 Tax=Eucalyptus grandis TaxID=71139 RepID=A0ACC3JSJ6_EUCGR|nr:hypothetical protein EUGRSUZ_H02455 [Eucalyptus grandis]